MRKTLCTLGLVAVLLLAAASDAFAQRRGGGGRGGGYYGSRSYYGGRGYYGGYYGWPSFYGGRYYYSPDYYYTTPDYYYSDAVTQSPPVDVRQSFYGDPNVATITVRVPNPDAQIWVDNNPTSQRGMERTFHTPSLRQSGTYTIKARWTENGRTVDQQRQVQVQPGQSVMVNFQANPGETLSTPRPPGN